MMVASGRYNGRIILFLIVTPIRFQRKNREISSRISTRVVMILLYFIVLYRGIYYGYYYIGRLAK